MSVIQSSQNVTSTTTTTNERDANKPKVKPSNIGKNDNDNNKKPKSYRTGTYHQSGFGAFYNRHNIDNNSSSSGDNDDEAEYNIMDSIPKSAVPHAIPSLAKENMENAFGHYAHDEYISPFSSYLYDRPKVELEQEQKEYETKLDQVRRYWGAWNFTDESKTRRSIANFDTVQYKDMNNADFPEDSWQMDQLYITNLIYEGKALVARMIEGIYAEYGHPTRRDDGSMMTAEEIRHRNDLFKVHISEDAPISGNGISYINQSGMDALVRKLLHGMITNDEFYVVLSGHSAAAGKGNNFLQQKTMQFQYIMEPIFHKLGMRLISRNLGMGGRGKITLIPVMYESI